MSGGLQSDRRVRDSSNASIPLLSATAKGGMDMSTFSLKQF